MAPQDMNAILVFVLLVSPLILVLRVSEVLYQRYSRSRTRWSPSTSR